MLVKKRLTTFLVAKKNPPTMLGTTKSPPRQAATPSSLPSTLLLSGGKGGTPVKIASQTPAVLLCDSHQLDLGDVVVNENHVLSWVVVTNVLDVEVEVNLSSTLGSQVAFQLENANIVEGRAVEDFQELFNTIDLIDRFTLKPKESKRVIVTFRPEIDDAVGKTSSSTSSSSAAGASNSTNSSGGGGGSNNSGSSGSVGPLGGSDGANIGSSAVSGSSVGNNSGSSGVTNASTNNNNTSSTSGGGNNGNAGSASASSVGTGNTSSSAGASKNNSSNSNSIFPDSTTPVSRYHYFVTIAGTIRMVARVSASVALAAGLIPIESLGNLSPEDSISSIQHKLGRLTAGAARLQQQQLSSSMLSLPLPSPTSPLADEEVVAASAIVADSSPAATSASSINGIFKPLPPNSSSSPVSNLEASIATAEDVVAGSSLSSPASSSNASGGFDRNATSALTPTGVESSGVYGTGGGGMSGYAASVSSSSTTPVSATTTTTTTAAAAAAAAIAVHPQYSQEQSSGQNPSLVVSPSIHTANSSGGGGSENHVLTGLINNHHLLSSSLMVPAGELQIPFQARACRSVIRLEVGEVVINDCAPGGTYHRDITLWNQS